LETSWKLVANRRYQIPKVANWLRTSFQLVRLVGFGAALNLSMRASQQIFFVSLHVVSLFISSVSRVATDSHLLLYVDI